MWPSRDNTNKPKEEAGHLVREPSSALLGSRVGTLQGRSTGHPKAVQALLQKVLQGHGQGDR